MRLLSLTIALLLAFAQFALANTLTIAARNSDLEKIAEFIAAGADVNESGFATPLQMAAFSGHVEAVNLLLSHGADIDAVRSLGSALHSAAQKNQVDVINVLLRAGANTETRSNSECTPLLVASLHGHLDSARALVEGGADLNAIGIGHSPNTGGHGRVNALHLAFRYGHQEVGQLLLDAGATIKSTEGVAEVLAKADPKLGSELTIDRCNHCHAIISDDETVLHDDFGPPLIGVFGRRIGSYEGFEYSEALKNADGVWTAELIYIFVVDAMLTFPGTAMMYQEGWTNEEVAHIAAYLASAGE